MAKVLQAIILAGYDFNNGGVDFAEIAQHRQSRLVAANPDLMVTIMDVAAGTTTISAMTPGPGGKSARTVTSKATHKPVTAKNYSKGIGVEHTEFDTDTDGRMSITDLYAAVETLGSSAKTQRSLTEVSIFSHGHWNGPVLVDSYDNSKTAARDPHDKDGRATKDFSDPNMGIGKRAAFAAAFTADGVWWTWGCDWTESYRRVTESLIRNPKYRTTPRGKLKDTDKITFTFDQTMADLIYGDDAAFFPQDSVPGKKPGDPPRRKKLAFERTVGDIKTFFRRGVSLCYHSAVGKAAEVQARGAFPGTYADYEFMDKKISQPLMEIPRNVKIFTVDLSPYLRMWQDIMGLETDPEGHGYGLFPKP